MQGTECKLTDVSPVGQGLEGSVHVAGVAYVLQPCQAWGRHNTPGKLKQATHQMLVNFDGNQSLYIVKETNSISKINILQLEQEKWLPAVS